MAVDGKESTVSKKPNKIYKPSKPRYLHVGPICAGICQPEDIIPELLYSTKSIRLSRDAFATINKLSAEFKKWEEDDDFPLDELLEDLISILSGYCPPFCYLGMHPDDGACLGVWPDLDYALAEGISAGDIYLIDDSDTRATVRRGRSYAPYRLHISDHGNASLYTKKGKDLWS